MTIDRALIAAIALALVLLALAALAALPVDAMQLADSRGLIDGRN